MRVKRLSKNMRTGWEQFNQLCLNRPQPTSVVLNQVVFYLLVPARKVGFGNLHRLAKGHLVVEVELELELTPSGGRLLV